MKRLTLVLLLSTAGMAQQWTIYYSQTSNANPDNSATVTPTVSITGNDGGYCSPFNGEQGDETPAVMLNGNPWAIGPAIGSGDMDGNPNDIDFAHTFPNVTLPANGAHRDMSYAAKVHVVCYVLDEEPYTPAYVFNAFYEGAFLDGFGPSIYPAPCTIGGSCPPTWPALYSTVHARGIQHNLASFGVLSWTYETTTFWGPPPLDVGALCYYSKLACTPGTTPTCTHGTGDVFTINGVCPNYIEGNFQVLLGACIPNALLRATGGPGPCD